MPKLPIIKSKDLVKALNKMGFFEYHRVGSHVQLKHSDGRRTTIPLHVGKDMPRGTVRAILKQIHISLEELIRIL